MTSQVRNLWHVSDLVMSQKKNENEREMKDAAFRVNLKAQCIKCSSI